MSFREISPDNSSNNNLVLGSKNIAALQKSVNHLPLTKEEEEFELNSTDFKLKDYPRIEPIKGTLGFLFKQFCDDPSIRNYVIGEFLEGSEDKSVKEVYDIWVLLDDNSKKRVDIFDIICKRRNIRRQNIIQFIKTYIKEYNSILVQTRIEANKMKLVGKILTMADKDDKFKDRELASRISELLPESRPLINIEDNSTKNTLVQNLFSEKNDDLKKIEEGIVSERGLLETNYVEGELVER